MLQLEMGFRAGKKKMEVPLKEESLLVNCRNNFFKLNSPYETTG